METGEVTEVEDNGDGSYLVWFGDPEFAESGVMLYEQDLIHVPKSGDELWCEGFDSGYGLTYLKLNNEVQFERSDKEAQLIYTIRKFEQNTASLRKELEDVRANP